MVATAKTTAADAAANTAPAGRIIFSISINASIVVKANRRSVFLKDFKIF